MVWQSGQQSLDSILVLESSAIHFSSSAGHGTKHHHMSTLNPTMGVVPTKSAEASRYEQCCYAIIDVAMLLLLRALDHTIAEVIH